MTNFEIMPELPKDRLENNPWPLFPRIYKVDYGHEESREVFGKDPREYSVSENNLSEIKMENLLELKQLRLTKTLKKFQAPKNLES